MHHTLFISDLHLCDSRPAITLAFRDFLRHTAIKADALYILGDLFEYWPGDDCITANHHSDIIQDLHTLTQSGVQVFFMHGNRDFLIGDMFANTTGITLVPDPTKISLYGVPVLLSHGDALCTDDVNYQQFRQQVRQPNWQADFLSKPLPERVRIIEQLRATSDREKSIKSMEIMDVNQTVVEKMLAENGYPPVLIHGHTHRPNTHTHKIDDHYCIRWVLGDWYEQGSFLRFDQNGEISAKAL